MGVAISLLLVVQIVVCLLIVLIVLMQRPKQEGLGAAFGGGMASDAFGAQATNVLQKITVWLAVIFFVNSLVMSVLYAKKNRDAIIAKVAPIEKPAAAEDANKTDPTLGTFKPGAENEEILKMIEEAKKKAATEGGLKPEAGDKAGDKPEAKAGDKPEAKAGDKPEAKAGDKPEAKAGDKTEAKAGDKPEAKAGDKPEAKAGDKPEAKAGDKKENE